MDDFEEEEDFPNFKVNRGLILNFFLDLDSPPPMDLVVSFLEDEDVAVAMVLPLPALVVTAIGAFMVAKDDDDGGGCFPPVVEAFSLMDTFGLVVFVVVLLAFVFVGDSPLVDDEDMADDSLGDTLFPVEEEEGPAAAAPAAEEPNFNLSLVDPPPFLFFWVGNFNL